MSGNTSPAETTRVHKLNNNDVNKAGTFVLYWMSNSLRSHYNYALAHASYLCEKYEMPLRVAHVFDAVAQDGKPLPERHAAFQLESLSDVQKDMHERNVPFVVINGSHKARDAVPALAEDAVAVVTDTSYLRKGRSDRHAVATALPIPLYAVEADVVVPVQTVSSKSEYAARTIRPKITRALKDYLVPMKNVELTNQTNCDLKRWVSSANPDLSLLTLEDLDESLKGMEGLDRGAPRVRFFKGGQEEAQKRLTTFLDEKLREYGGGRNEPAKQLQSDLSPYLRSGNISPVDIALHTKAKATKKASWKESEESFLEELIVRRELAVNACWFNADAYDVYEQIVPNFARESLALHKSDKRPKIFTYEELEAAVTEDPYWNAAQLEMVVKGKMHGYMRMYWVKRIIGWVEDPADAMDYAIRLNNRWELDAVDPNSYAGVIWCFGLHDRGWTERPIWGKVRYMNESGLKRKFNMPAYIAYVDKMVASEGLPRHIAELRKKHKMGGQQQTIDGSRKRLRSRKATSSSSKSGLRGSESKSVKRIKM
ncbi:Deoxyribodipyrimidine photo-lyase [Gracilariopsis chorda]|uniref:Deoxyribodipyrimidine photo-lyase n=1 Tax=Gracilariopsis chorda TaxID=448386 RepID=A0A2V3IMZ7_9FLOR|nr:Deoxyribodipyrimidine photo-lyase [Gracilariopsis chorda]|eukprot:PXF42490.1 Deoxyribodipyrimidine photo-lyase [Gracilariopsis chorda]